MRNGSGRRTKSGRKLPHPGSGTGTFLRANITPTKMRSRRKLRRRMRNQMSPAPLPTVRPEPSMGDSFRSNRSDEDSARGSQGRVGVGASTGISMQRPGIPLLFLCLFQPSSFFAAPRLACRCLIQRPHWRHASKTKDRCASWRRGRRRLGRCRRRPASRVNALSAQEQRSNTCANSIIYYRLSVNWMGGAAAYHKCRLGNRPSVQKSC
jgi:hypothetical protein